LLLVVGKDELLKTNAFDVVDVKSLGVTDLAKRRCWKIDYLY